MSLKPIGYRLAPIDIRSLHLTQREASSLHPLKRIPRRWGLVSKVIWVLILLAWASALTSHRIFPTFNYPEKALQTYFDAIEKSQQFLMDSKNARIKQMDILMSETFKVRPLTHFHQPIHSVSFAPKQVNHLRIVSQQIPARQVSIAWIPSTINAELIVRTSHSIAIASLLPRVNSFHPVNIVRPENLFMPVRIPKGYEPAKL